MKKIQFYDEINEEIEGSLLSSLRGYTLNSWYNHWTSILIEDLFKDHTTVLPTVGLLRMDMTSLDTEFYLYQDQQIYNCKSDILFLKYCNE